ncbi:unnamed protein product [Microthlaspi erraticum]|uniref:Disease resistance R13L4/SHOC-2-like LRR domain-containing protein n=1 Tax=Microthlaspi erraticum TaxID=1685480 RepID=A0A6D2JZ99_9BRAS|nr:unnamed protein product [Microthlaspi erraticum]
MSKSLLHLHFLSLLFLCCVSPSSLFLVDDLVACRPEQIQALTQFKNEFDTHRCNRSDPANERIKCDNSTGAITKLKLTACLTGTLMPNSSLFKLHHLRHLNLSGNNFISSSLPSEFGNLNRLEVLSLSSNGFIGQVPSLFSNLSQLNLLDLSHNELTGSFPLLRNLSMLEVLDLRNNHFAGVLNSKSSLFELHQLWDLQLGFNNFSSSLPFEIGNLNKLEGFSLTSNGFFGQVPPTISNLTQLTKLFLRDNRFTGSFPLIQNLTKLSLIELRNNQFSGTIPSSIFTLPFLSYLDMHGNNLNGSIEVPNSSTSSSLESLHLGRNHFEGKILEPISKLTNLKKLDLSYLNTSYPIDLNLFSSFKSLSGLDVSGNKISPASLSSDSYIPLTMEVLFLEHCDIKEFPNILKTLQNLEVLYMLGNGMNGKIPEWLWSLPRLNTVFLGNNLFNGFEGSSKSLVNSSVQTINLETNRFKGALPHLPLSIKFLSVDNNRIKDTFPFWLKALPDLQILTLRSNEFYGPISPPDQGPLGFPELRIFEISNNKFTGSLPPSYFVNWKASSLTINEDGGLYMVYESNPHSEVVYAHMEYIDLQYKGQIPESIGLLKALIALNFSNNAFTGHIPLSFANLSKLESLDLSSNQLSGTIPNGLGSLSFLAYINVSHNQLKGEIPQGTQITGQAKSSFEGNAGLCGLPLQESCFGSNAPTTQQPKEEDEERRRTSVELESSGNRVWAWSVVRIVISTSHCFIQTRVALQDNWSD